MLTITLSKEEAEMARVALVKTADDIEQYTRWIDDRPMLPERELAIERVKAQAKDYRALALRLLEAAAPHVR